MLKHTQILKHTSSENTVCPVESNLPIYPRSAESVAEISSTIHHSFMSSFFMTPITCWLLESSTQMCFKRASGQTSGTGSMTGRSGENGLVCRSVSEAFWIEVWIAGNWVCSPSSVVFFLSYWTCAGVCVSKGMSKCWKRLHKWKNI